MFRCKTVDLSRACNRLIIVKIIAPVEHGPAKEHEANNKNCSMLRMDVEYKPMSWSLLPRAVVSVVDYPSLELA